MLICWFYYNEKNSCCRMNAALIHAYFMPRVIGRNAGDDNKQRTSAVRFNKELLAQPCIMGILNVTPDSFSDGGRYAEIPSALAQVRKMVEDGAGVIDIGGESTRPGSEPVSDQEQIRRVVPVIRAIREEFPEIPISIDTSSSQVAQAALLAGADLINDVMAGTKDPGLLVLAARKNVPIVLMHSQGDPKTMQDNPYYTDVVAEVLGFLRERIHAAQEVGINRANIILDPGIGFGKRKQDNLALLAHLQEIVELGFPVLLGASRKRFMGNICEVENSAELVTATAVTTALGVMAGVQIFRVHDVKENVQAAKVAWAIRNQ
jgi:dihydropteroate synthase